MSYGVILFPTILEKDGGKGQDRNLYSDLPTVHLRPHRGYLAFQTGLLMLCFLLFVVAGLVVFCFY